MWALFIFTFSFKIVNLFYLRFKLSSSTDDGIKNTESSK